MLVWVLVQFSISFGGCYALWKSTADQIHVRVVRCIPPPLLHGWRRPSGGGVKGHSRGPKRCGEANNDDQSNNGRYLKMIIVITFTVDCWCNFLFTSVFSLHSVNNGDVEILTVRYDICYHGSTILFITNLLGILVSRYIIISNIYIFSDAVLQ